MCHIFTVYSVASKKNSCKNFSSFCARRNFFNDEIFAIAIMLFILTGLVLQHGRSALWVASDIGAMECVKLLLKYGAQVDLPVRCA